MRKDLEGRDSKGDMMVIDSNKSDRIEIAGESYALSELQLLTGLDRAMEPKGYILLLAKVLQDPMILPRILEQFCALRSNLSAEDREEMRLALIRVQIDSELRMHQDILRFQQRRYVAQVIEILLYKDMLLAPREFLEEEPIE
jgi:hypothetical protein